MFLRVGMEAEGFRQRGGGGEGEKAEPGILGRGLSMLGRWECRLGERGRGRLRGVTEVAAGGKGLEDLGWENVGFCG